MNRFEMRDILHEHGVEVRIGLMDEADAEYEAEAARDLAFVDEATESDEPTNTIDHSG